MSDLPDFIRIILIIATIISFCPQYARIISRADCVGIAWSYVLFNLISATEQLALGLHIIVDNDNTMDSIIRSPPTRGNWLNFAQLAAVWVCHLILFGLLLATPPRQPGFKAGMVSIYVSILLVSVAPVVFEATLPRTGTDPYQDRRWVSAFWSFTYFFLVNPIITGIQFAALFPQLRELQSRSDRGALSLIGLAIQGGVFFACALSWPLRMKVARDFGPVTWYRLVGWAAVDNGVFAFVQAVLWRVARRRNPSRTASADGERTPLLSG